MVAISAIPILAVLLSLFILLLPLGILPTLFSITYAIFFLGLAPSVAVVLAIWHLYYSGPFYSSVASSAIMLVWIYAVTNGWIIFT